MSLYEDEFKVVQLDLVPFFAKFPSSLRDDLKFHVNNQKLKFFPLFKGLDRSYLNCLGDCLKNRVYEPSNIIIFL